jgi:hypothetical protein
VQLRTEIEERGYVAYQGVWDSTRAYAKGGALVTDSGSTWIAVVPCAPADRPGKAAGWKLSAKGAAASSGLRDA